MSALENIAVRHRKKLGIAAGVLLLYTLAGFFLVPWLVAKIATDTVRDRFGVELAIEEVRFNPYVLSLRVDGLAMPDPSGGPFVGAESIYVNFQLSSLSVSYTHLTLPTTSRV